MANTVSTYRVVRGELLVGHSVRTAGDFVPEAETWESFQSHIRTQTIELVYVEKKILDAAIKKYAAVEKEWEKPLENAVKPKTVKKKIVIKKKVAENGTSKELSEQAV